jgi:hypothetical protein
MINPITYLEGCFAAWHWAGAFLFITMMNCISRYIAAGRWRNVALEAWGL